MFSKGNKERDKDVGTELRNETLREKRHLKEIFLGNLTGYSVMEHTITLKKLCSVNLYYSTMILNFKFRVFSQCNEVLRLDFGKNNKAAQKGPGSLERA